ncbi:MAG: SHOCT domain-containing protein [Ferruginibacter sp.]|nr:SHOCT domain-containing protein [Ferruginibacter sp.]
MKKSVFILLLCPLITNAQKAGPRFENDTLYTTSGYKIYKGQIIQLASGTAENSKFRFIKYNGGLNLETQRFNNTTILVKKLSDYKISGLGNRYIGITGTVTYRDGSKSKIEIDMNFDRAITNFANLPAEIVVPEEFRNKVPEGGGIIDEIERLFRLYKEGAITKEEYEVLKKKVIGEN